MLQKPIVRILDFTRLGSKNSGSIYAYHLDRPRKGDNYDTHHLPFAGWVLSKKSPIVSLEFIVEGKLLHKTQLNHPRPDVLKAHSDVSVSPENVGFSTALAMEAICETEASQLLIQAVFEDGSLEPLFRVQFSCQLLEYDSVEKLGPDFLIIGAMKAATSAIYDYLSHHPRVIRRYPKELHFFTLYFDRGLDWYLSQFSPVRENLQGKPLLTGEASPTYLVDPEAPARVRKFFPNTKIIASLRNPTDRAISQYYHQVKRVQNEKRSIERAFSEAELANIGKKPVSSTEHYIRNGLYAQHLKNWFEVFPKEQILVLDYHELETDPDRFVEKVFGFLGLQDFLLRDVQPVFQSNYPEPPPEVKQRLDEYFQPYNEELEKLIS